MDHADSQGSTACLPLNPFPLPLEQAGEGEPWGLMTGAKALFCLTAGKTEEENGRMEDVLEDPTVGLDDMTGERERSGVTFFLQYIQPVDTDCKTMRLFQALFQVPGT